MNEREQSDREAYYFGYYPETPEGIPRKEQEFREYLASLGPDERRVFCETMLHDSQLLLAGTDAVDKLPDYLQSMPPALLADESSQDAYDAQLREAWIRRIEDIAKGYTKNSSEQHAR